MDSRTALSKTGDFCPVLFLGRGGRNLDIFFRGIAVVIGAFRVGISLGEGWGLVGETG